MHQCNSRPSGTFQPTTLRAFHDYALTHLRYWSDNGTEAFEIYVTIARIEFILTLHLVNARNTVT